MTSTIRFYGLRLDNFTVNWGLTQEEREAIAERRHAAQLREMERQKQLLERQRELAALSEPVRPPAPSEPGYMEEWDDEPKSLLPAASEGDTERVQAPTSSTPRKQSRKPRERYRKSADTDLIYSKEAVEEARGAIPKKCGHRPHLLQGSSRGSAGAIPRECEHRPHLLQGSSRGSAGAIPRECEHRPHQVPM